MTCNIHINTASKPAAQRSEQANAALARKLPRLEKLPLSLTLLAGSLLLAGCQTTALQSHNAASPIEAKAALKQALHKQRTSAYSYHSQIKISPAMSPDTVNAEDLGVTDSLDTYCEDTHDQAYMGLLEQADGAQKPVQSAQFDAQRQAIKQAYIACSKAYQAWQYNQPDEYDTENQSDYEQSEQTADERVALDEHAIKPVSEYYQNLFDNYQHKPTKLDVKKAKLLQAYLLKPSSIHAQGSYQPAAGKFTILMSAQYFAHNNKISINQPIYVDAKTGSIYLWADNFAMLTSEYLDTKLGTTWHNKWLKLTLNDGTLPQGFTQSLIKAHFQALDRLYESAPVNEFEPVAPRQLNRLSGALTEQQLSLMLASPQVIRRTQTVQDYYQSYHDYIRTLYSILSAKYPQLVAETDAVNVSNTTNTDSKDNSTTESVRLNEATGNTFSSKSLVQKMLTSMRTMIDTESDQLIYGVYSGEGQLSDDQTLNQSVEQLYGLANNGQIQWQYLHNITSQPDIDSLSVDVFQRYLPLSKPPLDFVNLPANMQKPNANNSVDLRQYSDALIERYRSGEGTVIGRLLLSQILQPDLVGPPLQSE
ncbi:hypothetical protein [Psychrobacter sp. H7-1]|uniref:hypothetical protein n=1 Tax=Psychrobacter sp. H7-1 TaxID=1569265 RepID=UPI0019199F75|nr:hypothetical protein [Psychrobacter sp. H7-1]